MIKPIKDQGSSITQEEINPSELGDAVENIRNIKKVE